MNIPPDLSFADLALELDDAGGLHFLPVPIRELCLANGIDAEATIASEDQSCALIADWYVAHVEEGGARDAAVESILDRLRFGL